MDIIIKIYRAIAGLSDDNECFHDPALDLTWTEMLGGPYGGVYKGLDEVRTRVFNRIAADWEDFNFSPAAFHEAGNVVSVEGNYTGVSRKTGKKITARVIHLWKLNDGKILFEQFTDTSAFWKALE